MSNVKLSHGNSGMVHVYYNSAWETVCDDGFGQEEAAVICRQLNGKNAVSWDGETDEFNNAITMPAEFANGNIGQTNRPLFDNLACSGTETSLFDCPRRGANNVYFDHDCADHENAWVVCEP